MSKIPSEKRIEHLDFLTRRMRGAAVSILGCFLTTICINLIVDLSGRVYKREQLQDTRAFDLIGVMLASSAFVTTVGASLSAWLVIDSAADYKRLTADDEESN